jgi:hypothetical protein
MLAWRVGERRVDRPERRRDAPGVGGAHRRLEVAQGGEHARGGVGLPGGVAAEEHARAVVRAAQPLAAGAHLDEARAVGEARHRGRAGRRPGRGRVGDHEGRRVGVERGAAVVGEAAEQVLVADAGVGHEHRVAEQGAHLVGVGRAAGRVDVGGVGRDAELAGAREQVGDLLQRRVGGVERPGHALGVARVLRDAAQPARSLHDHGTRRGVLAHALDAPSAGDALLRLLEALGARLQAGDDGLGLAGVGDAHGRRGQGGRTRTTRGQRAGSRGARPEVPRECRRHAGRA